MASPSEKTPQNTTLEAIVTTTPSSDSSPQISLQDADEAFAFLTHHPNAQQLLEDGERIFNDPILLKKLERKIDLAIAPILAVVYFLQFLDKTTLQFTAVMGLREDTKLQGIDYSVVSLVFYLGRCSAIYEKDFSDLTIARIPPRGIPNPISRSTYLSSGSLPWRKYHTLGYRPRLPWSMHLLHWTRNRANASRNF